MRRTGFTLIEMLVVMTVLAILAAIAIPRYNGVRERGFIATMQSDLNSLRYAQEIYQRPPDREYATSVAELGEEYYSNSPGVTVTITEASPGFWAAEATHSGTAHVCRTGSDEPVIECVAPAGKDEEEEDPDDGK